MASYLVDVGDKLGVVSKIVDPNTGAVPVQLSKKKTRVKTFRTKSSQICRPASTLPKL